VITIVYSAADGDVDDTMIDLTGIGVSTPVPYVETTQEAIVDTTERFLDNGAFTRSGAMEIDIPATTADGGTFNATFTDELGNEYPMTGVLNTTAKTEKSTITYRAMNTGETITVAGLTMTAKANLTAAQVAAGFASLSEGVTTGVVDAAKYDWSGRLLGYSTGAVTNTNQIEFTSSTSNINVTDISVSSTGVEPVVTTVHGAPASSVTFNKDTAANSRVITDDLTYTFKGPDGAVPTLLARELSLQVSVKGAIPAMQAGDLIINGVVIGASSAADDPFSPVNNAAGSAIAKAAAINRSAAPTGQPAGEVQTLVFSGTPAQQGNITVSGVSVSLTASDTTPQQVAAKVATALKNSATFGPGSGRSVVYTPGNASLSITYGTQEGNAPAAEVFPGSTGMSIMVQTTSEYKAVNPGSGVYAKVNQNVMSGVAMTNNSRVSGTLFINGYATPMITSTLNNYRQTREDVVRAINMITEKTGVKAVDTGSDQQGVQLVAADGRNIEVTFATMGNPGDFGEAIGLREGVQAGTYSLESKVDAPIVISSSSTGSASRAGLAIGDYSKNQAVVNTSARAVVQASASQVESVLYANTVTSGDTYSVTVNGKLFQTTAAAGATPQSVRDALISLVNADSTVGVKASGGSSNGELILTANVPGTGFTLTTAKSATATATVTVNQLTANQPALVKPLTANDLVLNGVSIRASVGADDTTSELNKNTSSDPSASALSIAAAINASSSESGVLAVANGAVVSGSKVDTSLPILARPTMHSLFINGVAVQVEFVQNEPAADRIAKVVNAVNTLTGLHGVSAVDNGTGVSLTSDGRNLSVWFDSSIKDLKAANFGLGTGDEVAQLSRIQLGGTTFATTDTASVVINGVTITSAASGTASADALATALETAINSKLDSGEITNLTVTRTGSVLEVRSTVAGSGFTLTGASSNSGTTSVNLTTVTPNSTGTSHVTAVLNGNPATTTADTVYGTVQMIAHAPKLPNLPQPIGAPPSTTESLMAANPQPFTVKVGADGFGGNGNFAALGFHEGTFGGRSSEAMNPPRVGRLAFQVGASANQLITIDLADFGKDGTITGDITGDVDQDVANRTVRINTVEGASSVLSMLDVTMDRVNSTRATMGAVMNRLDHVINNLSNVSMNLSASRSQIQDADYAAASTDLAKSQIMQQAATAVLAQANTSQQSVLKLLQG
jgi:flagellin